MLYFQKASENTHLFWFLLKYINISTSFSTDTKTYIFKNFTLH